MRFHKQLITEVDPDQGLYGDCYRTVIACLLDMEILDVPNFADPAVYEKSVSGTFTGAVDEWLKRHGYDRAIIRFPTSAPPESVLRRFRDRFCYWILAGRGARGCNHAVICYRDGVVHDPSDSGVIGPCTPQDAYYAHVITPCTSSIHPHRGIRK